MDKFSITEVWERCPSIPDLEISCLGHVRVADTKKLRRLYTNGDKYWRVTKRTDNKVKSFLVHHLVLETFVGPRPTGLCGLHLDDDRDNNYYKNLYWGTRKQNAEDKIANGRQPSHVGERNPNRKLSNSDVIFIRTHYRYDKHQTGARALAQQFGVTEAQITNIARKRNWNV